MLLKLWRHCASVEKNIYIFQWITIVVVLIVRVNLLYKKKWIIFG